MKPVTGSKLESWIFDSHSVSAEGLGLYRIFTSLLILFFLLPATEFYSYLGDLPADFFNPPPGPMMLLEGFPSTGKLWGVHLLLLLSLSAMLVGLYTRWSSLLTGFLFLMLKGFFFSIGKIDHDLVIALVPMVFAFSNWGRAYSIDAWLNRHQEGVQNWPFTLLALFIGFMFFTAGFAKILGGWLDISTQATQGHLFNQYLIRGRTDLLAGYAVNIDSVLFWEFLDYATILFEAGFLLAIIRPSTTRIFVCLAVFFHFSTMMFMNIAFLFNFLAYAAFLNWNWVDGKIRSLIRKQRLHSAGNWPGLVWGVGVTAVFAFLLFLSSSGLYTGQSDLALFEIILVCLALPISVYGLIREILVIKMDRAITGEERGSLDVQLESGKRGQF